MTGSAQWLAVIQRNLQPPDPMLHGIFRKPARGPQVLHGLHGLRAKAVQDLQALSRLPGNIVQALRQLSALPEKSMQHLHGHSGLPAMAAQQPPLSHYQHTGVTESGGQARCHHGVDCSDMSELSHWPTCRPVGKRGHVPAVRKNGARLSPRIGFTTANSDHYNRKWSCPWPPFSVIPPWSTSPTPAGAKPGVGRAGICGARLHPCRGARNVGASCSGGVARSSLNHRLPAWIPPGCFEERGKCAPLDLP